MEIVLSYQANNKLTDIVMYLKNKFGKKSAREFLEEVDKSLELLSANYHIGKKYNKEVYSLLVVKQISVYYTVDSDSIYIITFFDNRQSLDKLNKLIS